jgi:pilus assembly protein Flp/PilA
MLSSYIAFRTALARQQGQGLVEYALILVLVAIVVIAVLTLMGKQIQDAFQDVVGTLQGN